MYKDAYGVRPRGIDTSRWTVEEFEAAFDGLQKNIRANEEQRLLDEQEAVGQFETRVTNLLKHTNTTRECVIAWLMDAEGAEGDYEYFCFTQGLPYGYFKRAYGIDA